MKPYISKYRKVRDHKQTRCIHCGRWVDLLGEKTCPKCGKLSLIRSDKQCCDNCHNVNCWQMQTPVLYNTVGTALSSGRTTHHMKHRYTRSSTPIQHMLEVLMSERYAPIHA